MHFGAGDDEILVMEGHAHTLVGLVDMVPLNADGAALAQDARVIGLGTSDAPDFVHDPVEVLVGGEGARRQRE